MQDSNTVHTPEYGPELPVEPEDTLHEVEATKLYQSITGSLLYLAQCARYDLCYQVNQLTRAFNKAGQAHMSAVKHVVRYLRGNPDLPIVSKQGPFRMAAYTN